MLCIMFDDSSGWVAHHTVFSVTCEILAALQTGETVTVVRTQKHRLDANTLPMFFVGWAWQGICRDLDPCCYE